MIFFENDVDAISQKNVGLIINLVLLQQFEDPRIAANEKRRKEALAHEATLPQYKVCGDILLQNQEYV